MTTPTVTLYASIADLRLVLDSTDAGVGTAAQLSDEQLTLALMAASDRVSLFAGTEYTDPVPGIVHDLTLDLAVWWATTYYLKQRNMDPQNPVQLRYAEAMKVLTQVRQGLLALDVAVEAATTARIINRIPNIFTGEDSNTDVDPATDTIYASTPSDMMNRRMLGTIWLEWQG